MRFLLSSFFILLLNVSFAQTTLTLEDAIAIAVKNNYQIELSRKDSISAAIDYAYRNATALPKLNGTTGLTSNTNDQYQKFNDGTIRQKNNIQSTNTTANLSLGWTVFNGLKLYATRDRLFEIVNLGGLGVKESISTTIAAVIGTYYGIVQQKQQLKAIEEQIQLSTERVKLAAYKLEIGVGTKPDLLQSKVDLNAQKAAQLDQITSISESKEELKHLLNEPTLTDFEVSNEIPFNSNLKLEEIRAGAEKNNPTLLMAEKDITISKLLLKERKAEQYPTITLNSNYNFNKLDNKAVVNPFSPLFSRNNGFNYGATITIPLLNNFQTRRNIKQAGLAIEINKIKFDQQKTVLNLSLIKAYTEYESRKRALQLEEENILLAKENVNIVFEVYKLNSTTLIQLKEAQKSLQDAYTRLIRARYNTKLAETELLRLQGILIK
jgi:outer membrane protein TolC